MLGGAPSCQPHPSSDPDPDLRGSDVVVQVGQLENPAKGRHGRHLGSPGGRKAPGGRRRRHTVAKGGRDVKGAGAGVAKAPGDAFGEA